MEPAKSLDTAVAKAYEKFILPAFMLPAAKEAIELAVPQAGDKVLDVACGTGLVARLIAQRVAPGGVIRCLDFDPAMIAVASELVECPPGVDLTWHCASALSMPFGDKEFDMVVCLHGLQFMPDFGAALKEMRRVMKPGARLLIAVWGAIERCEGHLAVFRGLERRQVTPTAMLKAFVLGEREKLETLATSSGFNEVSISTVQGRVRFPSAQHFVEALAAGAVAARHALAGLPESQQAAFMDEMREEFRQYEDHGGVAPPNEQLVLVARAG
jgi:ubiquinone/menaquinone biosynthesis C-methylase UbiE